MAILTINGVAVATPKTMSVTISDLSSSESGRTLAGKMQKDVIAKKLTLDLWNGLVWNGMMHLNCYGNRKKYLYECKISRPESRKLCYEKQCMLGTEKLQALSLVNGKEKWEGISFTLIEQ